MLVTKTQVCTLLNYIVQNIHKYRIYTVSDRKLKVCLSLEARPVAGAFGSAALNVALLRLAAAVHQEIATASQKAAAAQEAALRQGTTAAARQVAVRQETTAAARRVAAHQETAAAARQVVARQVVVPGLETVAQVAATGDKHPSLEPWTAWRHSTYGRLQACKKQVPSFPTL